MARHFSYLRDRDKSDPLHVIHVIGWRLGRFHGRIQWSWVPKDYRYG